MSSDAVVIGALRINPVTPPVQFARWPIQSSHHVKFHPLNCIETLTVLLTLKVPITTAADNIYKYMYFFIVFQRKQDLIFHVNLLLGRGLK